MRKLSELQALRSQVKRLVKNSPQATIQQSLNVLGPDDDPFADCPPGTEVFVIGGSQAGSWLIDENGEPQQQRAG